MSSIRFLTSVMCEDVRREEDGRAILLGVAMAGPHMLPDEELVMERVGFYLEAEVHDINDVQIRLVERKTGQSAFDAKVNFDFTKMEPATSQTPPIPKEDEIKDSAIGTVMFLAMDKVTIPAPGRYDLQYRIEGDDEWENIRDFLFPEKIEK